ncbi:MAG: S24 family peptidase [Methylovulum miyakonense]|uniref:XRE family transcriptional regulator n=1 Tax=Methylovulum miyakonense TaxID=645578 RepID=UPI003BB72C3B
MNDNFFSLAADRLKQERLRLGINQAEAAKLCSISREMWGKYERALAVPGGEVLFSFAAAGADINFVLTGTAATANQAMEQKFDYANMDYIEVPHYNIQAAAGSGALPASEELLKPLAFRRDWLAARHLSPLEVAIVDVKGDSMATELEDGDLVLVDKSQIDISTGKTYVLRLDGHILVKNLQMLPHGLVQVASFNQGFPPYQVDLSDESIDMAVIGRVVASMHEW